MVKISLPTQDDFYADLVKHPKVLKVVALSGGYSREEGNALLRRNHGVVASFSGGCWKACEPSNRLRIRRAAG